jgi:integrase
MPKNGLPRYCGWNVDRHGKRRVRFRRRGFSVYLPEPIGSEQFWRAYERALKGVKAQATDIGASRTLPGSFNALSVSYYRSPEFRGLKTSTQTVRRNIIESFRVQHGDKPITQLQKRHIKDIIGAKAETPEAANNLLKTLRLLLNYAVSLDMIPTNPAVGVQRYKSRGEGFHTWSETEVAQFEAAYPIGTRERVAFAILLFTAQRVGDAVRMGHQHVKDGRIAVRQEKTDTPLMIPMHPELVRILSAAPRNNLTFIVTDHGAAFTAKAFSNWFGKRCRAAGLLHCTAHGLRKTALTRLADAGCTVHEIAAISGHKSLKEIEHYTRNADQARLASQALRRQLLSNPETRLDKTGENG